MDFVQLARYFDLQNFDTFNSATGVWTDNRFKGQVKVSDKFISMWNRATRKRMLYVSADTEALVSPVIRVNTIEDIYMVGTFQRDVHADTHYRSVANIQHVMGTAQVYRRSPVGPSNDPGWAVTSLVYNSYADYELRSATENADDNILNYGSFFLFMPSDIVLEREDTVVVGDKTFYVFETYKDAGLSCARTTVEPDDRLDFVYQRVTGQTYDPNTQTNVATTQSFNVTGRVNPVFYSDQPNSNVVKREAKFLIRKTWFPGDPNPRDMFIFNGMTYIVDKIEQDYQRDEWVITACV